MVDKERLDILKFHYEMLQNEINENSRRGNLYKIIIIPITLGALGFAIQQTCWKRRLFITFMGFLALVLILLIDLKFTIGNNKSINKQIKIEELIKSEFNGSNDLKGLRDSYEEKPYWGWPLEWLLHQESFCKLRVNDLLWIFILIYLVAGFLIAIVP